MMNYIWAGIILLAVVTAMFTGRLSEVSDSVMTGAQNAISVFINLLGMMCLWNGIMKIAEKSNITTKFSKVMRPFIKKMFPGLDPDSPAAKAISMNISANLMGLGNAATPLGLEAMKHLQEENKSPLKATNHMVTFVVLNSAAIQLVPTTTIVLRQRAGSGNPAEIILPVLLCSVLSLVMALICAKLVTFGGKRHG